MLVVDALSLWKRVIHGIPIDYTYSTIYVAMTSQLVSVLVQSPNTLPFSATLQPWKPPASAVQTVIIT
ncbi:unnamed protein product [Fusarium graminearum]|uniref:Uncharacterized protein n=1 Tax=Gibberella zeae TaxID=5518 RepID=A0A9N8NJI4_GIBZA|nr:unnamed protein product [Fusarium graminearum]